MKTLIMHGSFGSPNENWFPWLKSELQALGHEVILEQFPVDDWNELETIGEANIASYQPKENLQSWEAYFVEHILPQIGGESVNFASHSLSPVFMLHMLEKYDVKLNTAVFVSPFFDLGTDEWHFFLVNKTFYKTDFDFETIRSKIEKSFVVYGDNDPYVPVQQPTLFAEKLGSTLIPVPGGEHCGSIFKAFPLVLDLLKEDK